MEGGAPISSQIAQKVLTAFRQMMHQIRLKSSPLSDQKQEVLKFASMGHSNKQVAGKLAISVSTVKTHIFNIYQKLHVTSRIEALTSSEINERLISALKTPLFNPFGRIVEAL